MADLDALPEEERAQWQDAMWFLLLWIRHRRATEEQDRLVCVVTDAAHKHREEVEKMTVTCAEALIEKGLQKGRRQGLQKGRRQGLLKGLRKGQIEALLRVLTLRFGSLPRHVPARIEKMSLESISSMFDQTHTAAQSLAELDLHAIPPVIHVSALTVAVKA